ncbi:MAG: stage III sporulation protein AB [Oscillospiraceae bacterium]|nr:stage III sporulation protein AB [Oscillospiraceae bacterium]
MKLLGLLSVMAAGIGLSLSYLGAARREIQTVRGLQTGIRLLRSELALRRSPVRELIQLAAAHTDTDARSFFHAAEQSLRELDERSFAALWSEACRSALRGISEENRRDLEELGLSLGRFELDDQLSACDRYLEKTEAWIRDRSARWPERRRLALVLGAAAGSFLCLLML